MTTVYPVHPCADLEDSTALSSSCPKSFDKVQEMHDSLLRELIQRHDGYEINTEGALGPGRGRAWQYEGGWLCWLLAALQPAVRTRLCRWWTGCGIYMQCRWAWDPGNQLHGLWELS